MKIIKKLFNYFSVAEKTLWIISVAAIVASFCFLTERIL